jgi:capsule polysaccharide export protein KpsE/RkpR
MGNAITFDTLAFVEKLETGGFTATQAKSITEALKDASIVTRPEITAEIEAMETAKKLEMNSLATKVDLEKVRADLRTEIEKVRADLRTEIEKVRAEIAPLKWMIGVTVAGIISLVIKAYF